MTVQRRRLVRTRDLAAFRAAIAELALEGHPLAVRKRLVIVPTHAAAELLRQTIETLSAAPTSAAPQRSSLLLPDLVTRAGWIARLHGALLGRPAMATRLEREIVLERAARAAAARSRLDGAPFQLRPGLVAAMLDLYDELGRRQRTIRRFTGALFDELRVERGTDRGSEGLIRQTVFLGFAFLGYARAMAASGVVDEHMLREELLRSQPDLLFDQVIVAVADHPTDPRGLWPADFDLLGRLRGVKRVDVVLTDEVHDAGFRERLEHELPGIEDARHEGEPSGAVLVRPAGGEAEERCFVARDREEELRDVARAVRGRARQAAGALDSTAIVFYRPLPYLYLARQVLADARVPYEAFDALPLAAEPYAALLDLVLAVARTGGTREAAVGLLRSGLMSFSVDGVDISLQDVAALDAAITERRATGEANTYPAEVDACFRGRETRAPEPRARALRAAQAAADIREELAGFRVADTAAAQVRTIATFLRGHERGAGPADVWRERHVRARASVLGVLDELANAFERHDNRPRRHEDVMAAIRHAIEARTFTPHRGHGGVHLVDAVAARFGEFDHVHLVGLVETDWPERPRRSIFYTSGMLKALGWPQERDQTRAQQAAFRDLLTLARRTTTLHAFQLEGDAVVARSPMIELARDLRDVEMPPTDRPRVFVDEILATESPATIDLAPETSAWLGLRLARPALDERRYGGFVDPQPPQAYRVSRVDRYVDCPFKYFAENVLGLPEEREEAAGLTPLERGQLVHDLLERFYVTWQQQGKRAITPATLPEALTLFAELTREELARLPEADRALEETRLLGSIVARGVAERVFELESDAGGEIVKRFLEVDLRGPFVFPELHGLRQRTIELRGKADRIDVFANGALRVIDYKLSRMPDLDTSIQLAVYAHAARQLLERREKRPFTVHSAMYLAFGDDRKFDGPLGDRDQPAAIAVEARASDFAKVIDEIEAGHFPPRPKRPGECAWCRYAGVCRKEYRIEDDEAAELV